MDHHQQHLTQEERREYFAHEFRARFEAWRQWAKDNWPVGNQPLSDEAFVASEREVRLITGAMLHPDAGNDEPPPGTKGPQYEDVTPAPWP